MRSVYPEKPAAVRRAPAHEAQVAEPSSSLVISQNPSLLSPYTEEGVEEDIYPGMVRWGQPETLVWRQVQKDPGDTLGETQLCDLRGRQPPAALSLQGPQSQHQQKKLNIQRGKAEQTPRHHRLARPQPSRLFFRGCCEQSTHPTTYHLLS